MAVAAQVVGIFGFTGEDHIGKISFPPIQVKTSMYCNDHLHLLEYSDCRWSLKFCGLLDSCMSHHLACAFLRGWSHITSWVRNISSKINGMTKLNILHLHYHRQFHPFQVHFHTSSLAKIVFAAWFHVQLIRFYKAHFSSLLYL